MHPVAVMAVRYGPEYLPWLWSIRSELGAAGSAILDRLHLGAPGSGPVVDRIGPAIVSVRDGQTEILGLLHRQSDSVGQVAAAVDHVLSGQQAVSQTLGLLNALSMVGLGVTVLGHSVLAFQLHALTKRMKEMAGQLREVKAMLAAGQTAMIKSGIDQLSAGVELAASKPDLAVGSLQEAIAEFTKGRAVYADLLHFHLGERSREAAWLASRHLTTAAMGECAAYLKLGQKPLALRALDGCLEHVQRHAGAVFQRTVSADPAKFLMPMLAQDGITLDAMAELYRQAGLAGISEGGRHQSASEWFECNRGELGRIRNPRLGASRVRAELANQWAEACAAVEEVNRVRGLRLAISAYDSPARSFDMLVAEILQCVEERQPTAGTCLAVFPDAGAGKTASPKSDG